MSALDPWLNLLVIDMRDMERLLREQDKVEPLSRPMRNLWANLQNALAEYDRDRSGDE